jgi:serine/threonine protein kinase
MHPFVGTELAHYRIESLIGRGGMASVYEAEDLLLGRRVALKVLAPELSESSDFRDRFLRESRFAAGLEHPNIVPIYEAGDADGLLYIAMRYLSEGDLNTLLAKKGQLEPAETVAIVAQVAAALDAAHAAGLVHRDVKPANILIGSRGDAEHPPHVYLSDFGLIKRSSSMSAMTATGRFVGTMNFAAPEQIRGEALDARSDVYALGCLAYQCLTGSAPFVRDDQAALLWAHLTHAPPRMAKSRAELAAADPVVAKALAKSPDDRYSSCGQFATALGRALAAAPAADLNEQHSHAAATAGPSTAATEEPALSSSSGAHAPPKIPPAPPPPSVFVDEATAGRAGSAAGGGKVATAHRDDRSPRRTRSWLTPTLIAVAVALALTLVVVLANQTLRAGTESASSKTAARTTAQASTSATPQCKAAIAAAKLSVAQGERVESAFKEHLQVMYQRDMGRLTSQQALMMGMPALNKGAAASVQFDQTLGSYRLATAKCRSSSASRQCTTAVDAADQALGHAQQIDIALRAHTNIMNQLNYGRITGPQATTRGKASLDKGETESTKFGQALARYQPLAATCR